MPEDERDRMTEQGLDEQEQEELAEMEVVAILIKEVWWLTRRKLKEVKSNG